MEGDGPQPTAGAIAGKRGVKRKGVTMTAFTVEQTAPLQLLCTSPLTEMYTLSPFVWSEQGPYELLLRAVNHSEGAPCVQCTTRDDLPGGRRHGTCSWLASLRSWSVRLVRASTPCSSMP